MVGCEEGARFFLVAFWIRARDLAGMKLLAFDEFCEEILGVKLKPFQKNMLKLLNTTDGRVIVCAPKRVMSVKTFRRHMSAYLRTRG